MRILVIDNVNYTDYPTGGIMSFYRSLLPAFGNDLVLAGIMTETGMPVGKWGHRNIFGIDYEYYTMANVVPSSKKPLVPERITNSFRVRRHIRRIVKRNDFDVILTQTPEVVFSIPNRLLEKTCYVLPGVGNPLAISRYPWARPLAKMYDRFFMMPKAAKAKWLLAAADERSRELFAARSNGRINADRVKEFPTRYDEKYYQVKNRLECRKQLCLHESENIFITVGRLGWFKGWKLMIDALKVASSTIDNGKLLFIGDGEDEEKIKDYIKKQHMQDSVLLLGKKAPQEIGLYLNAADVFVMGSFAEGWSTTLLEACACGVPCVVTDFGSAKSMVTNGVNGYVVEGRDEQLFSKFMLDALQMNREEVATYNKKFEYLSLGNLKKELTTILEQR